MSKIPKLLHYCFGFDPAFGGKPWSLAHYVCVKSALERLKPLQAFLYYEHEPRGAWWQQTKNLLTPVKITAPRQIYGNPLHHFAHQADVVRLEVLIERGGIYLDADVFVHRDFDHLLHNAMVMGQEGIGPGFGLANAVILAEPGAPFLKKWHREFRWFRSKGRDEFWNEHSVRVPKALFEKYCNEITILPHNAFFWPLWTEPHLKLIYDSPVNLAEQSTLANHLWECAAWDRYLEHLTPGKVRANDCNFHRWARPFLVDLPDEFGAAGLLRDGGPAPQPDHRQAANWGMVRRNAPCPCGSGKKYKHCHARIV